MCPRSQPTARSDGDSWEPGGIAASVAADLSHGNNRLYAVAARDADRSAAFAARFGASHSRRDYRAVVEDPDVDIVYIATTHPFHREQALMAIDAGKPVLIEKPLASTLSMPAR